jgi:Tol biopolymer transport system component
VLFTSLASGVPSIAAIAARGGAAVDIASNGDTAAATSDGATIVFARSGAERGVWRVRADGRDARRLASVDALDPVVSRDDRNVLFLSIEVGVQSPWVVPIEGGEPRQVVAAFAGVTSLDVSPDGAQLVFFSVGDENRGLIVVCDLPQCANRRDLPAPANFRAAYLRWTPDGKAIAYVDDAVAANIWALPREGGAPSQLTQFTEGEIWSFAWSRDGTRLAVIRSTTTHDIVLLQGLRE